MFSCTYILAVYKYVLFLESWLILIYVHILLYRGCPLSGVKLCCQVGTTEFVHCREVKCIVCLREVPVQTV